MSMKSSRLASEAAQSAKLRRLGAQGSTKMATQAEHAMRKYANGGIVGDDDEDEELEGMGDVEGDEAMPRLDRPSRGKKDKKGGTNVNVIIMPPAAAGAGGPPVVPPVSAGPMPPPPPMAGPPPGAMAGGPPMMPPGAGGPPMRKHGGGVNAYANGGKVKKADGGSVKAKHDDVVEDKKLVKGMVKGNCLK